MRKSYEWPYSLTASARLDFNERASTGSLWLAPATVLPTPTQMVSRFNLALPELFHVHRFVIQHAHNWSLDVLPVASNSLLFQVHPFFRQVSLRPLAHPYDFLTHPYLYFCPSISPSSWICSGINRRKCISLSRTLWKISLSCHAPSQYGSPCPLCRWPYATVLDLPNRSSRTLSFDNGELRSHQHVVQQVP